MPLFEYSGFDAGGRRVAGTIDSLGRKAAALALRDRGIFPTTLEPLTVQPLGYRRWLGGGQRIPAAELAAVTRQLATLLGAGLALDDALGTVAEQAEIPLLHRTLITLREEVRQGDALHAALARQPGIFADL